MSSSQSMSCDVSSGSGSNSSNSQHRDTMKHFESDVSSMFKWISDNLDLFMSKSTRIGRTTSETMELQQEHDNFYSKSMQSQVHVMRLQEVAERLSSNNPYAAGRVTVLYSRLERCWLEFKSCLEERSGVLSSASIFYQKAESFISSVPGWSQDLESPSAPHLIPHDVTRLEELVHRNQNLFQSINSFYEEIYATRKKLNHQLQHFINYCYASKFAVASNAGQQSAQQQQQQQQNPMSKRNAASDYEEAIKHVSFMMHEVMSGYRALESIWQMKKMKLHQKLALALFQDDVRQVIDWIEVHGEGFLRKNMTIGKNSQRARALQKSHQHFEAVASNTYLNGEKLLLAAGEFAETGECDPEEIYRVARQLDQRVRSFAEKVERRRQVLNLAAMFFTHEREISTCLDQLRSEVGNSIPMQAPPSVEACELALEQVSHHKDQLNDVINNTISEGETLVNVVKDMMDSLPPASESENLLHHPLNHHQQQQQQQHPHHPGSSAPAPNDRTDSPIDSGSSSSVRNTRTSLSQSLIAIQSIMERLDRSRPDVEELCNNRKLKMELCLQLRVFERDALAICNRFEDFAEEIDSSIRMETAAAATANAAASPTNSMSTSSISSATNPAANTAANGGKILMLDVASAEKSLQLHNEKFTCVQQMAYDFFQRGQELAQVRNPNDGIYQEKKMSLIGKG